MGAGPVGFLKRLLGGAPSAEELRMKVESGFAEIERQTRQAPRKAREVMGTLFDHGPAEAYIDFGTPHHEVLLELYMKAAELEGLSIADLPRATVHDEPDDPVWKQAVARAEEHPEEVTLIRFPAHYGGQRCTLASIDALALMAQDASVAAAFPGEAHSIYRNGLLPELDRELRAPFNAKVVERQFDDLLYKLGFEGQEWDSPLGYQLFVYRPTA